MGMKMEDGAAQATLALLKIAKGIADTVVGDADQATVRAVFDRLCLESDTRLDVEPVSGVSATRH
jgi:flavoprotein